MALSGNTEPFVSVLNFPCIIRLKLDINIINGVESISSSGSLRFLSVCIEITSTK